MNSIYNYLVTTSIRYNNLVDVEGKELIVNTQVSERDAIYVNRIGQVIATPLSITTPVEKGDLVVVNHNVFRRWFDVRGRERNTSSYMDEDTYQLSPDLIYAYKKQNGHWRAMQGFCFVRPITHRIDRWSVDLELTHMGELYYKPDDLDIDIGDLVGFRPESEYAFLLEGTLLYRVRTKDLTWTTKKSVNELLVLPK